MGSTSEHPYERVKINFDGTLASVVQTSGFPPSHHLLFFDVTHGVQIGAGLNLATAHWAICLGDDGNHAAAIDGNVLHFIDVKSGSDAAHRLPTEGIDSVYLDSDSGRLVTWSVKSNIVQVWRMPAAELCFPTIVMEGKVSDVRLSPDSAKLLACCWDSSLDPKYGQLRDLNTGREIGHRLMHGDGVLAGCFSANGMRIGTGSEDFTAGVWNAFGNPQRIQTVRHHNHVTSVAFSPDGTELLTGSLDETARIWSSEAGDPLSPPFRHRSYIRNAIFLGSGDRVYVETGDDARYLWDVKPLALPVEDVSAIVDLVCGVPSNSLKDGSVQDAKHACEDWQRLRAKYPVVFKTTDDDIARWHEVVAEESELGGKWHSAAFHLKYLAQTGDANILARLAKAEINLAGLQ